MVCFQHVFQLLVQSSLHMKYGLDIVSWPGMPGRMLTPSGPRMPAMLCLIPIMPGMLKGRPAAAMDMFCWRLMGKPPARFTPANLGSMVSGDPPPPAPPPPPPAPPPPPGPEGESSSLFTCEQEDM